MSECSFVKGVSSKVINQIRVREEKFGKPIKTDEELSVIHGNCPWVVLRSGIDAPLFDVISGAEFTFKPAVTYELKDLNMTFGAYADMNLQAYTWTADSE